MSTISIGAKESSRIRLLEKAAVLLDCPVSGTGAQAAVRDLDIYASGNADALQAVIKIREQISKNVFYVGPFGSGMKLKLIANLLVTIHNVAAAEALILARHAGMDLQNVVKLLRTGAGASRMLEVRGPMMAEGRFEPATMKIATFMKDLEAIKELADSLYSPTPLLDRATEIYQEAMLNGCGHLDTAAVFSVFDGGAH